MKVLWGLRENLTVADAVSTLLSDPIMARMIGFTEALWRDTMLTSRPMTSTPESLQVRGPFSSSIKPSGRTAA